jgi:hypothetical protein
MMLASLRGRQAEGAALIEGVIAEATAGGQGIALAYAHWAAAILANGLGRYADALAAATQASEDTSTLYISMWALPELIEAAARTGDTSMAGDALIRLAQFTRAGHTNPEIAAQLFLSIRTVEWHLRKIFTELGIGSRRELRKAL